MTQSPCPTAVQTAAEGELPLGFEVRLRSDVRPVDNGRALLGGSPVRVVRMTPRAMDLLAHGIMVVEDRATARLARKLLDGNLADPSLTDLEEEHPELTVVVPVRDRVEQLSRCLAALSPLPVIVVDDASLDAGAVEHVARQFGADFLPLPVNVGPAGARNAGLRRVPTRLVAFVDSDVTVRAEALQALTGHFRDPRVALVGPAVVGTSRSKRPRWFERYDVAASSLDLGEVGGQVGPGAAIGWLPSACLVGRTAQLEAGFDESMRVGEDVDLVWRLGDRGFVVRYDPSVVAHHDVRSTVAGWLGRKFVYGTGGADLAARHGSRVAPAALSPVMAVGALALLARRSWSPMVAGAAVTFSVRRLYRALPLEHDRMDLCQRLSLRGMGWAVRQESALLLRHWWPVTLVAVAVSRSARRSVLSALVVDAFFFMRERKGVSLWTTLVARRADDLAYGAGLWAGAVRARSVRCLMPRRPWT